MNAQETYRLKALVCLREAKKMHNPSALEVMLGIARNYLILAEHAERHKAADEDPSGQKDS